MPQKLSEGFKKLLKRFVRLSQLYKNCYLWKPVEDVIRLKLGACIEYLMAYITSTQLQYVKLTDSEETFFIVYKRT